MFDPIVSILKHSKKYVLSVFLKRTRIALVWENSVIDIVLESGARGRNHTFPKYRLDIDG